MNSSIHNLLQEEGIEIKRKGDWQVWWHYAVPFYFFIVGIFDKPTKVSFYKNYATTLGRTIYLANFNAYTLDKQFYEHVLWHERQHVLQWLRSKAKFVLTYLLSPKRRAEFEYEAYARTVLTHLNNGQSRWLVETELDNISRQFRKGSIYMMDEKNPEKVLFSIYSYLLQAKTTHENFDEHWPDIWALSKLGR